MKGSAYGDDYARRGTHVSDPGALVLKPGAAPMVFK